MVKELLINTERPFTKYSNKEILEIIKNKFKDDELKFSGWLNNVHVISINGVNYKVMSSLNGIKLKETVSNHVRVSSYPLKQKYYKEYNDILNN